MGSINLMRRLILISLLAVFVAGCHTRHGLYETTPVDGWRLVQAEGGYNFMPLARKHPEDGIVGSTPKKGELYVHAYFPRAQVKFAGCALRITPHDGGKPRVIPFSGDQTINVSDTSDFTLEILHLAVDGELLPPLAAHFRWSDRSYWIFTELM